MPPSRPTYGLASGFCRVSGLHVHGLSPSPLGRQEYQMNEAMSYELSFVLEYLLSRLLMIIPNVLHRHRSFGGIFLGLDRLKVELASHRKKTPGELGAIGSIVPNR